MAVGFEANGGKKTGGTELSFRKHIIYITYNLYNIKIINLKKLGVKDCIKKRGCSSRLQPPELFSPE